MLNDITITQRPKKELREIIDERIKTEGPECDLNDIDVSNVTDMSRLFIGSEFNGDISNWDVSKVTNMKDIFKYSSLEGHEPKWYKK